MSSKKRTHRSREFSTTEDSSEDSDISGKSTEDTAKRTKEKLSASRSRNSDGSRSRRSRGGGRSSIYEEKVKRKNKHARKVSKDRKRQRSKTKDAPEQSEDRDGVPLRQATKELQTKKQSCLAFISSTRITSTAVSHSSTGEERPTTADDRQQSSSSNDASKTPRSMAPMSKEDYDRKRNTIRRVVDPETGRSRLIRGEGEVLEEIVSRDRHKEINKLATRGDGDWFLKGAGLNRQT